MFKYFLIFNSFLLIIFSDIVHAQTSFAVLPMEVRGDVKPEKVEEALSSLYQNLIESGKYIIVERKRIKDILNEQALQISGVTDYMNAVKLGHILNVDKIISTAIFMKNEDRFAININVINVETGRVEFSKEVSSQNYTAGEHGRFCAGEIIIEYPLTGRIEGKAKDIIVVNIGSNHGLKRGDRLFVARDDVLKGDNGETLIHEYRRIGLLEVTDVYPTRAKTKISQMEKDVSLLLKGDVISSEPVPKSKPTISKIPLLGDIVKGKQVLDDDMEKKQYLSVSQSQVKSYINGKLYLDSRPFKSGHAYCYYPSYLFDKLSDFILEGDIEFKEKTGCNKAEISFRSNGIYTIDDSYSFFFNNIGVYEIDIYKRGTYFNILQNSTPFLNRGMSINKFRIVAYGAKFDLYINDSFLVSFEDELFDRGTIGFKAHYGSNIAIDNVKLWEAVKR